MAKAKTPQKEKRLKKQKNLRGNGPQMSWRKVMRWIFSQESLNRKTLKKVARPLKRSSEKGKRRKGTPLQSAMAMLNFYINRVGKKLPTTQKKVLNKAKNQLWQLYGKPAQ